MVFKYIIVESGAILFNENTVHAIVGEGFKKLKIKIFSAGFVHLSQTEMKCYGESVSLKVKSHPEADKIIIGDLFNPNSMIKYLGFEVSSLYQ